MTIIIESHKQNKKNNTNKFFPAVVGLIFVYRAQIEIQDVKGLMTFVQFTLATSHISCSESLYTFLFYS